MQKNLSKAHKRKMMHIRFTMTSMSLSSSGILIFRFKLLYQRQERLNICKFVCVHNLVAIYIDKITVDCVWLPSGLEVSNLYVR